MEHPAAVQAAPYDVLPRTELEGERRMVRYGVYLRAWACMSVNTLVYLCYMHMHVCAYAYVCVLDVCA